MTVVPPSDIITFKVGGRCFTTTKATVRSSGAHYFQLASFGPTSMPRAVSCENSSENSSPCTDSKDQRVAKKRRLEDAKNGVDCSASDGTESTIFIDRNPDVFHYVLDFMRSNSLHPDVVEDPKLLKLLKREAKFFIYDSLLTACEGYLQTYVGEVALAMKRISDRSRGSEGAKESLIEQGAFSSVLNTMREFSDSIPVQKECCRALSNLLCSSSTTEEGGDDCLASLVGSSMGGIELLLKTLTQFPSKRLVQERSLTALGVLTAASKENRDLITELGGHRTLLGFMSKYPGETELLRGICVVLGNLTFDKDTAAAVVKEGLIPLVAGAINRHRAERLSSEGLLSHGCRTLRNLARWAEYHAAIEESGGIPVLEAFRETEPLAREALECLLGHRAEVLK